MRILGISGSLGRASHNTALLREAAELAPPGVELELYEGLGCRPTTRTTTPTTRPPSAALWGKPIAVIGASATDYGAIWAQDHLLKALGIGGARVLEAELAIARSPDRFDAGGRLTDEDSRERLAEVVEALVEHQHHHLTSAA
jgi:chromate reductase, NAD(P)H dehydrogenase (quinone)